MFRNNMVRSYYTDCKPPNTQICVVDSTRYIVKMECFSRKQVRFLCAICHRKEMVNVGTNELELCCGTVCSINTWMRNWFWICVDVSSSRIKRRTWRNIIATNVFCANSWYAQTKPIVVLRKWNTFCNVCSSRQHHTKYFTNR